MQYFPAIKTRLSKLKQEIEDAKAHLTPKSQVRFLRKATKPPNSAVETYRSASASSAGDLEPDHLTDTGGKARSIDSDADREHLAVARYTHLKVLHDFIEEELGDVLELRRRIDEGKQERIRFEDLWHLFRIGEIVYSTEKEYGQLYKVFFLTGGQSLKRTQTDHESNEIRIIRERLRYWIPPEQQEEDEEETIDKLLREEGAGIGTLTPFKVDCYVMGFDGEYCGPVAMMKKIRAYVGEREITSLPVYPLKFHPRRDFHLQDMEIRGRKFLFSGMIITRSVLTLNNANLS